ncbi:MULTISPECIES: type I-E CRISPR-associated protein Cse1/CasA [Actinomycetaceae]|jgi:CRISPR system CASCADE complex protein casA|uniref:type I-E CRISPR-associated protein Cse1/CasA n=1 Tax=Actinomycetaceae TaxID=2049 RepID=UPI000395FECE|nr:MULTISPECIES: type I-E CRISPR-associated protein Cse1/CasA [Actinomycetaceae]ERH21168.1 CRISPR system CASCADE complex protein CasA [Actinomyces sp. oral taxon 172 str. F0311]WLD77834.1 type I-E CRISPR-associated protein Cse1/CasA [Schaalia sp. HMT-172]
MKNPEYNLLDEPWIPVRLLDGTIADVGLLELLRRTTEIADLACELPTQSIAIQRLVLAIAYRVAPPRDARDWVRQWDEGAPTEQMIEYLERWRDRFFLFGGRFPFMQVADLRTAKEAVSGLEKLIADVPNGEQFFTTRHGCALACIPPSEAARWLVHAQAYDPSGIRSGAVGDSQVKGGKGYPIGPSWCGHLGLVWLKGKDLDETLVLNLVPTDAAQLRGVESSTEWGACSWEVSEAESAVRGDYSLLDPSGTPRDISIPRLLTWHSRRVRLVGNREGVTGVVLAQGDKLAPQQMHRYEPQSLWRYSTPQSKKFKQDVYMPRKYEAGRALWRNLPGTLPTVTTVQGVDKQPKQEFLPSATLSFHYQLDNASIETAYPKVMRIQAVGVTYGPQEATFEDIYSDELTLSVAVMRVEHEDLSAEIDRQVRLTEEIARDVGNLAANLARAAGESGEGAGDGARDRAKELFFSAVDTDFRTWLTQVDGRESARDAGRRWECTLRQHATDVQAVLVRGASSSAIIGRDTGRGYMNVGIAENYFRAALNKHLPLQKTNQEGTK